MNNDHPGFSQLPNNLWHRLRGYLLPNLGTVLVVALMLVSYRAWAAPEAPGATGFAPSQIPYQGSLTTPTGQPVNGNLDMTFKLYNVSSGGTALWTEAHTGANAVPVVESIFHVLLGSLTPIPSTVWNNSQLFLGIKIGSDAEMTPRQVVGAVPAAMQASTALSVPDAALGSRHFAPLIYRDFNPSTLSTTSTTPVATNVSVMVACDVDCSLLVLHRAFLSHSVQNGGVGVQVLVDGAIAFTGSGAPAQPYVGGDWTRFEQVSGFKFVNLASGAHTVEVKYYCITAGTCYYFGSSDGKEMESLSIIVFAQP